MTTTAVRPTSASLLVVGSGPAGVAAAKGFRDAGGEGDVMVLSADTAMPYERPPLSKDFLRGDSHASDIGIENDSFYRDQRIVMELETRVRSLNPSTRTVELSDGRMLGYQTCVLATGAEPRRLDVPGGDDSRVLLLRSLADASRLVAAADNARSAIVVGSGFIGCEAAASLASRGLEVTLVTDEDTPHAKRLGADIGARIVKWLRAAGVELITGASIQQIEEARRVRLDGGDHVAADLILTAVGVRPRVDIAQRAGLVIDKDRIAVDQQMRTSATGVLAAGDVTYPYNARAGRRLVVEHWGDAELMGRIAGSTAAGHPEQWAQSPGFWSTIGDRTLKYAAWGDGFDEVAVAEHTDGFTAWYRQDGVVVGVLTHERDEDYERGRTLVEGAAPLGSGSV